MMVFVLFLVLAVAAGAAGGALSGLQLAGKDLGNELAALMGVFYGLLPVFPAAVVVALYFLFTAG
jgi:hypothetical protein